MAKGTREPKILIGWNEWCALPALGIPAIKAKIDTGAKTSALHAFNLEAFYKNGKKYVHFQIHPLQNNNTLRMDCQSLIIDDRQIMSSNGHKEQRYVIITPMQLGSVCFDIELTLSNRDPLQFRMLLGREALSHRVEINPARAQLQGKRSSATLTTMYADLIPALSL